MCVCAGMCVCVCVSWWTSVRTFPSHDNLCVLLLQTNTGCHYLRMWKQNHVKPIAVFGQYCYPWLVSLVVTLFPFMLFCFRCLPTKLVYLTVWVPQGMALLCDCLACVAVWLTHHLDGISLVGENELSPWKKDKEGCWQLKCSTYKHNQKKDNVSQGGIVECCRQS